MVLGGICFNMAVTMGVRADWPTKICQKTNQENSRKPRFYDIFRTEIKSLKLELEVSSCYEYFV